MLQIFTYLQQLPADHPHAHLVDEFTFTAMISLCGAPRDSQLAFELLDQMRSRGIAPNVHTYSALMNVCIKCGQLARALEVYSDLQKDGCVPNVVTFNTLIDVYGKNGQWAEALQVIREMDRAGPEMKPVARTYNTLMIACNVSGQWQEALKVYDEMVQAGHVPNTTTYNALISAYSRSGKHKKVSMGDAFNQLTVTCTDG